MTPLERLKAIRPASASNGARIDHPVCYVHQSDLAKLLAVAEAAQERFDKWTRDTYIALDKALEALTTEER